MPAPLRGSLASLERQNDRLDAEGLERIEDEADLAARIADKLLVPLPVSSALTVNPDLEENHRYCRPWTAKFLADLARAHEAAFHRSIEVSSAVRTVEYQKRLMETNGNAAPAEGDMVSPHLTGATVDIAKKGLSRDEIAWMRRRLADLQTAGKIDVEEEFKQSCFHITVYKSYVPARKAGEAAPAKAVAGGGATAQGCRWPSRLMWRRERRARAFFRAQFFRIGWLWKSWNDAVSNFPTTTAAAGIYVLKIEWSPARFQSIPQGLKPSFIRSNIRHD